MQLGQVEDHFLIIVFQYPMVHQENPDYGLTNYLNMHDFRQHQKTAADNYQGNFQHLGHQNDLFDFNSKLMKFQDPFDQKFTQWEKIDLFDDYFDEIKYSNDLFRFDLPNLSPSSWLCENLFTFYKAFSFFDYSFIHFDYFETYLEWFYYEINGCCHYCLFAFLFLHFFSVARKIIHYLSSFNLINCLMDLNYYFVNQIF